MNMHIVVDLRWYLLLNQFSVNSNFISQIFYLYRVFVQAQRTKYLPSKAHEGFLSKVSPIKFNLHFTNLLLLSMPCILGQHFWTQIKDDVLTLWSRQLCPGINTCSLYVTQPLKTDQTKSVRHNNFILHTILRSWNTI